MPSVLNAYGLLWFCMVLSEDERVVSRAWPLRVEHADAARAREEPLGRSVFEGRGACRVE